MTHNKYLKPQFLEGNGPISAKSSAQILYLNFENTLFSNVFITVCVIPDLTLHLDSPVILFSYPKNYTPYWPILFNIQQT